MFAYSAVKSALAVTWDGVTGVGTMTGRAGVGAGTGAVVDGAGGGYGGITTCFVFFYFYLMYEFGALSAVRSAASNDANNLLETTIIWSLWYLVVLGCYSQNMGRLGV